MCCERKRMKMIEEIIAIHPTKDIRFIKKSKVKKKNDLE